MTHATRLCLTIASCLFAFTTQLPGQEQGIDVPAKELFKPGVHPRLFFSADDLPGMRKRAAREPWAKMLEQVRIKATTPVKFEADSGGLMYDMRLRDLATLYAFTGEQQHADTAAELTERFITDETFWRDPKSKGLTRAAGAYTVALAYDLCYDGWKPAFRDRVSKALKTAAEGLIASMGDGANNDIANNWQGVRYGAAGVALLACDEPDTAKGIETCYTTMVRHLKANLGGGAWNPEGIGYTVYPWTFTGPFGIAARRAELGDLRRDVPQTLDTLWTTMVGTVNIPNLSTAGLRADLSDDHPAYDGRGTGGLVFFYTPQERVPAVKWMYDYLHGDRGDRQHDSLWGGALYGLMLYPADVEAKNPQAIVGLTYTDASAGVAIFRNRFQDENDTVAVANATTRRPAGAHNGPDTNTIRLIGLGSAWIVGGGRTSDPAGQTNLFANNPPEPRGTSSTGELVDFKPQPDGSGMAILTGSSLKVEEHRRHFVVDYSGKAGVPGLFVNSDSSLNGKLWRLNTPEFNQISTDGNTFTLTGPDGSTLRAVVLEPEKVTFRTGTVERGGGAGHSAFGYRGTKYINNKWIEFDVDGNAAVLFTLQKQSPPAVNVQRSLHAVLARVGEVTVLYDRDHGSIELNPPNPQETMANSAPLTPRGLEVEVAGDDSASVSWIGRDLEAEKLLLQRRDADQDQSAFETVAELEPQKTRHRDRTLQPRKTYVYRIVAANAHGQSPSKPAEPITTWEAGVREYIEDFAPTDTKTPNRLGQWKIVDAGGANYQFSGDEGSPRNAEAAAGYIGSGSVKIGQSRAFYLEDVRADLSSPSAQISFDFRSQATTVFSPILKLADGRWVMGGRTHDSSRHEWKTLRFDLASVEKWWLVDPMQFSRGELIKVTPKMLEDIRGVGVHTNWVINQKWAQVDQFHLRGKNIRIGASSDD